MKAFFAALQFLTVFPVPPSWGDDGRALHKSVPCFPLVGLLLGGLVALAHWILDAFLPEQISVWIAVLLLSALSGGLHLDGLADTADGLFSARSRERMLAIMRDSHIGTMGVLALVFAIGLKVAALSSLTLNDRLAVLVLMPLAGRTAQVLMLPTLPNARPDGGLASIFLLKRSRWALFAGLALLLAVAWILAWYMGVSAAAASLAASGLLALHCRRKLGGFTGDTQGACSETAETALAITAAVWASAG
jgi:adenosylcobinamide-GDP ribazoletransferase